MSSQFAHSSSIHTDVDESPRKAEKSSDRIMGLILDDVFNAEERFNLRKAFEDICNGGASSQKPITWNTFYEGLIHQEDIIEKYANLLTQYEKRRMDRKIDDHKRYMKRIKAIIDGKMEIRAVKKKPTLRSSYSRILTRSGSMFESVVQEEVHQPALTKIYPQGKQPGEILLSRRYKSNPRCKRAIETAEQSRKKFAEKILDTILPIALSDNASGKMQRRGSQSRYRSASPTSPLSSSSVETSSTFGVGRRSMTPSGNSKKCASQITSPRAGKNPYNGFRLSPSKRSKKSKGGKGYNCHSTFESTTFDSKSAFSPRAATPSSATSKNHHGNGRPFSPMSNDSSSPSNWQFETQHSILKSQRTEDARGFGLHQCVTFEDFQAHEEIRIPPSKDKRKIHLDRGHGHGANMNRNRSQGALNSSTSRAHHGVKGCSNASMTLRRDSETFSPSSKNTSHQPIRNVSKKQAGNHHVRSVRRKPTLRVQRYAVMSAFGAEAAAGATTSYNKKLMSTEDNHRSLMQQRSIWSWDEPKLTEEGSSDGNGARIMTLPDDKRPKSWKLTKGRGPTLASEKRFQDKNQSKNLKLKRKLDSHGL